MENKPKIDSEILIEAKNSVMGFLDGDGTETMQDIIESYDSLFWSFYESGENMNKTLGFLIWATKIKREIIISKYCEG